MASIKFDHVWKRFGEVSVLKDLDIDINDQEFLVLVGPSGCGKTTALRCLAGLEEITEGNIMIGDRVVNDVPPKDRDIAMVFQSYALYPHLSVYENIAFGLRVKKVDKGEVDKRVHEAAKILGLEELLKKKPRELRTARRPRPRTPPAGSRARRGRRRAAVGGDAGRAGRGTARRRRRRRRAAPRRGSSRVCR